MSQVTFEGIFIPNVTPFKNGEVDEDSLRRLVDYLIEGGVTGLIPSATTGESATLSHDEHIRVIQVVAEHCGGRVPVIASVGTNATDETISLVKQADKLEVQGYLVVCPYYNRPSQRGILEHFRAVASVTDRPIIVYNIPMRTGRNIETETLVQLSQIPNIVGVKDCCRNLTQTMDTIARTDGFAVLSGEDDLIFAMACLGGHGAVAAVAHVMPAEFLGMLEKVKAGGLAEALEIHYKLLPLVRVMFKEPNPAPVKAAMKLMDVIESDELRLPMTAASAACREDIAGVLHGLKIL